MPSLFAKGGWPLSLAAFTWWGLTGWMCSGVRRQLLTVDEVVGALTSMSGIDVTVIDLEGKSDLASYMVFVTGRSVPHMRKMADTIVKAVRAVAVACHIT